MSFGFKIQDKDFELNGDGTLKTVENKFKLKRDFEKILTTRKFTNSVSTIYKNLTQLGNIIIINDQSFERYNKAYGTLLQDIIGSKSSDKAKDLDLQSNIIKATKKLIDVQANRTSETPNNEKLIDIELEIYSTDDDLTSRKFNMNLYTADEDNIEINNQTI